jgi:hypothetical protein
MDEQTKIRDAIIELSVKVVDDLGKYGDSLLISG